jgi:hypothetical protein
MTGFFGVGLVGIGVGLGRGGIGVGCLPVTSMVTEDWLDVIVFFDWLKPDAVAVLVKVPAGEMSAAVRVCVPIQVMAGAIAALQSSLRHRPAAEKRSRAIVLARLAEQQLAAGHLDQAVSTWHESLDDYAVITSGRADAAVRAMRSLLDGLRSCPEHDRDPRSAAAPR